MILVAQMCSARQLFKIITLIVYSQFEPRVLLVNAAFVVEKKINMHECQRAV